MRSRLTLPFPVGPGLPGRTHSGLSDPEDRVLGDTALPFTSRPWHLPNSIHENNSPFSLWLSPEMVHPLTLKPIGTCARRQFACLVHPLSPLAHPTPIPTPCTQRQPGKGIASPRDDRAERGQGQRPSAAGGRAQRSSVPTAHTPVRSDWTRQRGDSLSEKPGAKQGRGCLEGIELILISSQL